MISESTAGSMPFLTPSASASAVPLIRMPSSMLLQILATCPAPLSPAWKMFLPMASSTGLALSKPASGPPTINVRVPALAPPTPPETGASSQVMPRSAAAAATARASSGEMVEASITSGLPSTASSRPGSPSRPR